jgi:ABC-type lipoprotein release transport system permease subunit
MPATRLLSMGWRNLWRHRRRTLLTLVSISFGVFLAVVFTGLQDRSWDDMINLAARLGGGHVSLQNPRYLDQPTLVETVQGADALQRIAQATPGVSRTVVRISGMTMLSTAGKSQGVAFVAFDPAAEDPRTLSLLEALVAGRPFRDAKEGGIILGERLARNLGLRLGGKVVYTLTDRDGEIVSGLARLSGILRTGSPTADGALALLPIDAVRQTLSYGPREATQVAVFLADQRESDVVAAGLQKRLGGEVAAVPWHEAQPELAGFIAMKVGGMRVMEIFIALLVAAGIFNTLFVSVTERFREFGIMLAIGFSPLDLFTLVMLESFWLGLLGLAGAALITAGPYAYLSVTGLDMTAMYGEGMVEVSGVGLDPVLRVGIYPENLALIAAAALLATLLAGLYPAWRAGRVEPVDTIKLV